MELLLPGTLIWTELNTDPDEYVFRSHLYRQSLPNRTLALAFKSLAPQLAGASGSGPANRSILQRPHQRATQTDLLSRDERLLHG
jgi:hypothetical protein